jgi:hypothetical protein
VSRLARGRGKNWVFTSLQHTTWKGKYLLRIRITDGLTNFKPNLIFFFNFEDLVASCHSFCLFYLDHKNILSYRQSYIPLFVVRLCFFLSCGSRITECRSGFSVSRSGSRPFALSGSGSRVFQEKKLHLKLSFKKKQIF